MAYGAHSWTGKPGSSDADDGEYMTAQPHVAADDVVAPAEPRAPEFVADDRNGMRPRRRVVGAREQPAASRIDAHHVEEIARDDVAFHELGGIAGVEAD